MKTFTLDDIVDIVHEDLQLTGSKKLTRKILRKHFDYILKIMKSKRNRLTLFECDMLTMYTNPDVHEMMGKVADLDETTVPAYETGFSPSGRNFKKGKRHLKRAAYRADEAVEFLPKLHA